MFIGENLTNLRTMHGYSRKQLSDMLGVTEQAIWQYENGYTFPKVQIVNELKEIFNVKSKYFYTPDKISRYKISSNIDVMNIAYRSKVMNTVSKTQSEAKHVEFLDTLISDITVKIKLPSLQIVRLRDEVISYLNQTDDDRKKQIEKVAQLSRERLGLAHDANDQLMYLVEKSGIFVIEKAIDENVDAYSLWTKQDRAYIVLGNMKQSAARRNFDIAHELGHLLLHYRVEFSNLDKKEHKNIENEANSFAGALLLPEKEFTDNMLNVKAITNPDAYLDLKKKWKVSLQMLAYRANQLGIIKEKEHRNFYAALHRKSYLKQEPLDKEIPIQRPKKIPTIIDFISKQKLVDVRQLIEEDWKVEIAFFHRLTGISTTFFNEYYPKYDDFNLQNIVHLSDHVSG